MKYSLSHYSLQGGRSSNQDRVSYAERDNSVVLVLADGLGGHRGGDVAAEAFTQSVVQAYLGIKQPVIKEPSAFIALSMLGAHNQVLAQRTILGEDAKPRTTGVVCLVQDGYAYWAHVGDSRLYHFRGDTVVERTRDHSVVERMFREGLIGREEMRTHPKKSHITQCIGSSNKPKITLGKETRLQPNDMLLLCSDGVWEALSSRQLAKLLAEAPVEEAVENILHAVEDKMGQACDNISIIVFKWEDSVTTALPLQKGLAGEITEEMLREQAMIKSARAAVKQKSKKVAKKNKPKPKAVKDEIADIENYLNKRGRKT